MFAAGALGRLRRLEALPSLGALRLQFSGSCSHWDAIIRTARNAGGKMGEEVQAAEPASAAGTILHVSTSN